MAKIEIWRLERLGVKDIDLWCLWTMILAFSVEALAMLIASKFEDVIVKNHNSKQC